MRSRRHFILLIATGAAIVSCRHASPETSGSEPYDLRQCVRRELQREGFRIEAPYPNFLYATTGAVGPESWREGLTLPDGSQIDRVFVSLTGLRVNGETSVRDRAETGGWRQVPRSTRVNRTIENVYKLCPAPGGVVDTTGSR